MKILFVISSYYPDGAGSGMSVRHLAESIARRGHESVVLRISRNGTSYEETRNGVKIYARPMRNIHNLGGPQKSMWRRAMWHCIDIFNPLSALDFYKILRREKPDVVNTSVIAGFSTSLFFVAWLMRIPLIHTLRDYYLLCPQNGMYRHGNSCESICASCRPFMLARKISGHFVTMYLANSEYVLRRHEMFHAFPKGKLREVQYNMNPDDKVAAPRKFPAKEFTFGYIGRLAETKGIHVLLDAARKLKIDGWKIIIAGEGEKSYVELLKKYSDDPRIFFCGHADPDEFYGQVDALVCPSIYNEPLARVVYEAYRAALPVIAAGTGGTPEIVESGKTGHVYEARNADDLAAHMNSIASNPASYEALSAGAAEKAKIFACSAVTESFLNKVKRALET